MTRRVSNYVAQKTRQELRRKKALHAACVSGKKRYKDERSALDALARIQAVSNRPKVPQRAYLCPECAGWHVSKSVTYAPKQRTPMAQRSPKTAQVYRNTRIPLVIELLAERPWCEIRWDQGCTGRATTIHEIKKRSRGGSIIDRANCVTACAYCNGAVEDHPEEAHARGFAAHSWEAGEAS